jgi:hypothetical protein
MNDIALNMDLPFGDALILLKDGHKLARAGWNGKNLFVYLIQESIDIELEEGNNILSTTLEPFFILVSPSHSNTWVPSVSDILAEDWMVP